MQRSFYQPEVRMLNMMLSMIQSHAISLFSCTVNDRVSVNHCVWLKLEELFQPSLLELKRNVHPLDGISNVL